MSIQNSAAYVVLTTSTDQKITFEAGFKDGVYFEGTVIKEGEEGGGHTVNAFISELNVDIDGNGWRDIESGGYLEEFLKDVVFGERDAEEFLANISEAIGSDDHGIVH